MDYSVPQVRLFLAAVERQREADAALTLAALLGRQRA